MINKRQICSKENPMLNNSDGRWAHPEAKIVYSVDDDGRSGGNFTRYKCPCCEHTFEVNDSDY